MRGRLGLFLAFTALAIGAALSVALVSPRMAARAVQQVYPSVMIQVGSEAKVLALVIDDGPAPATTSNIAALLRAEQVPATFFMIGARAEAAPESVAAVVDAGHELGVHFYQDRRTSALTAEEVKTSYDRTLAILTSHGPVRFVRPGHGLPSYAIEALLAQEEMTLVMGDIPAFDTFGLPDWVYLAYLKISVRPGSIVTFHDHGQRGQATLRSLPAFIAWARDAGYSFVSLDGRGWPQADPG